MIDVIYACPDWCIMGSMQVKKGNELGKELESIMKEGKLVPTEVTVRLLRQAMQVCLYPCSVGVANCCQSANSFYTGFVRSYLLQLSSEMTGAPHMQESSSNKFLIDGFPRAIDQAETFEQEVKPPALVLFFDCPEVRYCSF